MGTDFERFVELFKSIGIEYEIHKFAEATKKKYEDFFVDRIIELPYGVGYGGFFCEFYFLDGKFVDHGVFE